jgi:hypothetical protein
MLQREGFCDEYGILNKLFFLQRYFFFPYFTVSMNQCQFECYFSANQMIVEMSFQRLISLPFTFRPVSFSTFYLRLHFFRHSIYCLSNSSYICITDLFDCIIDLKYFIFSCYLILYRAKICKGVKL